MSLSVVYKEDKLEMKKLRQSPSGPVGRHMTRLTNDAGFFIKGQTPKPGGPGRGKTKINFATGELLAGIRVIRPKISAGELEGFVVALPKHAYFVHEGTKPHVIRAKRSDFMTFFWHRVGHVVSFKKVSHPGTPAIPFMVKGLRRAMR